MEPDRHGKPLATINGRSIGGPSEAKGLNGVKLVGRTTESGRVGVINGSYITCYEKHKLVQDIEVGDLVMTHKGRFRPVLAVHADEAEIYDVAGAGHRALTVSVHQRLWSRRNTNPQRTRNLKRPRWVEVGDAELGKRWYWASPTLFPEVPMPELPCGDADVQTFMWLVGRWVADGIAWGNPVQGIPSTAALIVKESEFAALSAMVALSGYEPKRQKHANAACTRFYSAQFTNFAVTHFGKRAEGKRLPTWLLGASRVMRHAFLEGYLSGDGHWSLSKKRWVAGTASKELAIGLKLLGQSLDYSSSLTWADPKVTRIGGVELTSVPQRSWRVHFKERGRGIFEDGFVWQKMRTVTPGATSLVYDLVVDEDFSYIADGIVQEGGSVGGGWQEHAKKPEPGECFPAGTLILTREGCKAIETIEVGDEVVTHHNRFRRVTHTMQRERPTVKIRAQGHPSLECSPNHKFWAIRELRAYVRDAGALAMTRIFDAPEFIPASELEGAWLGTPLRYPRTRGSCSKFAPVGQGAVTWDAQCIEFYWLMGIYMADGYVTDRQVTISTADHEVEHVSKVMSRVTGKVPGIYATSGAAKNVTVYNPRLCSWLLDHFGKLAKTKRLPTWSLSLTEERRRAILAGYTYGDGNEDTDVRYAPGRWKATTVGKALAVGIKQLATTLGYSVSWHEHDHSVYNTEIRGRKINSGLTYQLVGSFQDASQGFSFGGHWWQKVREVAPASDTPVTLYDLTVDEDHAFNVESYSVSDCSTAPMRGGSN
jgi:intein/homing endonuclease